MKDVKVAKRYAKALLLLAVEEGKLEEYTKSLAGVAAFFEANPEVMEVLTNPIYESAGRKKVMESLVVRMELELAMAAFLKLLLEKGRLKYLASITETFLELADEENGLARASVASAVALGDEEVEKIKAGLSEMTGKQVEVDISIEPELIGGIVTRIGDIILDGSVKTQLQNLKETLKRSEAV